eukprot:CAMPEP_0203682958 /NCGR_PEP_ID=MMETSP0090-20130426/47271_1 /ASSEMBLY_ACC=CAM_ASM_001088 /TAXON_ID=426623 /ORGANISM="Chaetoceros affinis, Strain CCMP159" /LENGTH=317 /DNA_ID=CAMNT_0050552077 /DNA_START=49 /DNA_END=1002 /DNA_ORIENTATION=+
MITIPQISIPVLSKTVQNKACSTRFPVNRIYCIGRNYREHAIEMGHNPDREPPFFFQKPSDAVVHTSSGASSSAASSSAAAAVVPYPPMTSSLHYEAELILAIGKSGLRIKESDALDHIYADAVVHTSSGASSSSSAAVVPYPPMTSSLHYEAELILAIGKSGLRIKESDALDHIYGFAVGCDLTRRDLQSEAKQLSRPWATAKGFDCSAPIGFIVPKDDLSSDIMTTTTTTKAVLPPDARISLFVNGEIRQDSTIDKMIWSIPEMISHLSNYFKLKPGDLIMTGTPAGVGALHVGDYVEITCGGLPKCCFSVGEPE